MESETTRIVVERYNENSKLKDIAKRVRDLTKKYPYINFAIGGDECGIIADGRKDDINEFKRREKIE